MHERDIPDRWKPALYAFLDDNTTGKFKGELGAMRFDQHLRLNFLGGSTATFVNCFYLTAPDRDEMLVMTEHDLHHIFPFACTEIELLTDDDIYGTP